MPQMSCVEGCIESLVEPTTTTTTTITTTTTTTTITTTQPELTAGRGCIKARDNGYAELTIGGGRQCVSSISMIWTNSEKLHCGISPAQKHNWGCGLKRDVGIVMTDAND